jgi:hypothetical protein
MAKVLTTTVNIAAGEAVSSVGDLRAGTPVLLLGPAAWDSANASFQISADGTTFSDLFTQAGVEVHIAMGAGRALLLPPDLLSAANYIKIRSGLSAHPITQQESRDFVVTMT